MIDRELLLPKSWTSDPARCIAAGKPDDVATKPELAQIMSARTVGVLRSRRGRLPARVPGPAQR
jgi:SRSO17 transposase